MSLPSDESLLLLQKLRYSHIEYTKINRRRNIPDKIYAQHMPPGRAYAHVRFDDTAIHKCFVCKKQSKFCFGTRGHENVVVGDNKEPITYEFSQYQYSPEYWYCENCASELSYIIMSVNKSWVEADIEKMSSGILDSNIVQKFANLSI